MNQTQDNATYPKYLYGAAVQGIQEFIFQTNKLKEILGASELVAQICTDLFEQELSKISGESISLEGKKGNAIVNAAGNIKYIFDSEEECKKMARVFPKTVMEFAPGITISQSVVPIENSSDETFKTAVNKLEKNLRTQRNKPMRNLNIGLMGILRSRETGLPVSHIRGENYMDSGTFHKLYKDSTVERKNTTQKLCEKAFGTSFDPKTLPFDISEITGKNDWIAIIHADGNGLGQVIQQIGAKPDVIHEFSEQLDIATTAAAQEAFKETFKGKVDSIIPLRPIVLSGDDLTVICRADLAIPYVEKFLECFENQTQLKLGTMLKDAEVFTNEKDYLTACAGIAFVKSSFPFHFGYQLAEALCDRAKKDTKALYKADEGNLPASCLMFHKVQDSFVVNYNAIVERELTPQPEISFEFGPYYREDIKMDNQKRWSIDTLKQKVSALQGKNGNAIKSGLRNWLTLLHDNPEMAKQKLSRMKEIAPADIKKLIDDVTIKAIRTKKVKADDKSERNVTVYPVYDILALNSITNQIIKSK